MEMGTWLRHLIDRYLISLISFLRKWDRYQYDEGTYKLFLEDLCILDSDAATSHYLLYAIPSLTTADITLLRGSGRIFRALYALVKCDCRGFSTRALYPVYVEFDFGHWRWFWIRKTHGWRE